MTNEETELFLKVSTINEQRQTVGFGPLEDNFAEQVRPIIAILGSSLTNEALTAVTHADIDRKLHQLKASQPDLFTTEAAAEVARLGVEGATPPQAYIRSLADHLLGRYNALVQG